MRKGKMIAQGAHASMKVFFDHFRDSGDDCYEIGPDEDWIWSDVKTWIDGSFTKIAVGVSSIDEFLAIKTANPIDQFLNGNWTSNFDGFS